MAKGWRLAGRCATKKAAEAAFLTTVRCGVLRRRRGRGLLSVALAELLDTPRGIHDLLFAGVEGVACRAHFDMQRLVDRRARLERDAAAARHIDFSVFGMDIGFHFSRLSLGPERWNNHAPEFPLAEITLTA